MQCFRDILSLGNGFWHIGECDYKSTLLGIWGEDSGVDKDSHNGLLEVGKVVELQTKLGQHAMQTTRFEFVLGIEGNGLSVIMIQDPMAPLLLLPHQRHVPEESITRQHVDSI